MKCSFVGKWFIPVVLLSFMWTTADGKPVTRPDFSGLVSSSKFYGRMTKTQAAEIIEKCAKETYGAKALADEKGFFMDATSHGYPDPLEKRTITKFKWEKVRQIGVPEGVLRITYEGSVFGMKQEKVLQFSPKGEYELADLALAATVLTGLPLSPETALSDGSDEIPSETPPAAVQKPEKSGQTYVPPKSTKDRQKDSDLEERLLKLKDLYDKGLISETVYEAKQTELLDRMLLHRK